MIAGAGADIAATAMVVVLLALLKLARDNSNGTLNSITVIVSLLDWGGVRQLGW